MSTLSDQLEADLEAIEDEGADIAGTVTFLYDAHSYTATRGDEATRSEMQDAGFMDDYDLELIVRTSQFAAYLDDPQNNETVTINSVDYQIKSISKNVDSISQTWRIKKTV